MRWLIGAIALLWMSAASAQQITSQLGGSANGIANITGGTISGATITGGTITSPTITASGSANNATLAGSATTAPPTLTVTGSDNNIGFTVQLKGAGSPFAITGGTGAATSFVFLPGSTIPLLRGSLGAAGLQLTGNTTTGPVLLGNAVGGGTQFLGNRSDASYNQNIITNGTIGTLAVLSGEVVLNLSGVAAVTATMPATASLNDGAQISFTTVNNNPTGINLTAGSGQTFATAAIPATITTATPFCVTLLKNVSNTWVRCGN